MSEDYEEMLKPSPTIIARARNLFGEYARLSKNEKIVFLSYLIPNLNKQDIEESKKLTIENEKQEAILEKARAEKEKERIQVKNLPDSKFPHLWTNKGRNPEAYETELHTTPTEDLRTHVEKIKKNPHAVRSIYNYDVSGFIQSVEAELMRRQQAEQTNEKKGILTQAKEKIKEYAT